MEAEILYTAVFLNEKTKIFAPEKLTGFPDIVDEFTSDEETGKVVKICDLAGSSCCLYNDLENEHLLLRI